MRERQTIPLQIVMAFFAIAFGCLLAVCEVVQASESIGTVHRVSLEEVRQVVIGKLRSRATGEEQLPALEDVDLPLAVPMRVGSTLRVSSACWDQDAQRARFRLECAHIGDCLPFWAYVRTTSRSDAPACRSDTSSHAARSATGSGVRAGERARAVLRTAGVRINAAVTCLQSGDPGEVIRVRGREGRIFRARIIGRSLVEASLE